MAGKNFDQCFWFQYDSYQDICLYEVGSFCCPPDYDYGPIIRDTYILHYIVRGRGRLIYHDREYALTEKQIFVIPAGETSYYQADHEEPWEYLWIRFSGSTADRLLQKSGITNSSPVFSAKKHAGQIEMLLRHILQEYHREYEAIGSVYRLFQEMTEEADSGIYHRESNRYVDSVRAFIQQKYAEPVSIQEISDYLGLNRSYLCRLFKKEAGEAPQEYLLKYRMKKAEQLLEEKKYSVREIAYMVGYGDSFSFSKAFKRFAGMAPTEYGRPAVLPEGRKQEKR